MLQSPRLSLRMITPETYHWLFGLGDDAFVKSYLACADEDAFTSEKARYEGGLNGYQKSFCYFQMLLPQTQEIIGWCGFHTIYLKHDRAEIGYQLYKPENRGKGYMKEVLPLVMQYGFETLKLHRIEAFVGERNEPSLKLVRANGFLEEGLLREHYKVNGVHENSLVFGAIRS